MNNVRDSYAIVAQVKAARERYSASDDDRLVVVCFFDFQEIKDDPKTGYIFPLEGQEA